MSNVKISELSKINSLTKTDALPIIGEGQTNQTDLRAFIDFFYPIGTIYETIDDSFNPNTTWTGTWEKIGENRAIMGASDSHPGGATAEAGLPNITGSWTPRIHHGNGTWAVQSLINSGTSGALFPSSEISSPAGYYQPYTTTSNAPSALNFDASRVSSIYGNSTTVQPPAIYVYLWQRVA